MCCRKRSARDIRETSSSGGISMCTNWVSPHPAEQRSRCEWFRFEEDGHPEVGGKTWKPVTHVSFSSALPNEIRIALSDQAGLREFLRLNPKSAPESSRSRQVPRYCVRDCAAARS